jgi:signal transduction histidine kinase
MQASLSLLLVEDNPGDVIIVREALREANALTALRHVTTLADACLATGQSRPDAILLDLNLPDSAGLQSVERVRAHAPRIPIVVFTGLADEQTGVEAVRVGAQDYLVKGRVDGAAILRAVWYAIERKRIEDRLLSVTEALAASNQALDEFASVASHDLREPLAKIMTLTRIVADARQEGSDDRGLLEEVLVSGRRMQRLIDGLLGYARAINTTAVHAPAELELVLDGVLTDLTVRIASRGARIDVAPLPVVRGNALQLHQLFLNLLSNALKFASPARPLRVTIGTIEDRALGRATVIVSDNGIGFPRDDAERIFRPFAQLGGQRGDGVGLGLAIAKRIVEAHGGTLSAEGFVDRGATFTITLPLAGSTSQGDHP